MIEKEIKLKPDQGERHILIEPMMFGDWRVAVWDENLNGMLDKDYFIRGEQAAIMVALEVKKDLFPDLEIYRSDVDTN